MSDALLVELHVSTVQQSAMRFVTSVIFPLLWNENSNFEVAPSVAVMSDICVDVLHGAWRFHDEKDFTLERKKWLESLQKPGPCYRMR